MKLINELLREYRLSKGLTLEFVANRLNKPLSRLSALERGSIKLTVEEFIEICIKGYNINPNIIISQRINVRSE